MFFFFILLVAYKQFVGEFWLRGFVVNYVKLSLLLWQWNRKYNTKDFNKMNFVHLEKFWKQESIIILNFNIIYVSSRYHLSYCILSIRIFLFKNRVSMLKVLSSVFFCNLQLLIYISHSVSVCVCVGLCVVPVCQCVCMYVLVCKRYFRICFRCSLFCSLLRLPLKHSIYIIN